MSERLLVLGDIHGAYRALQQVIDRCNYDPIEDRIIFLGDVCDGWSETYECIEYLIELDKVGGVIPILGNHDEWFRDWIKGGMAESMWYHQGGKSTLTSYGHEVQSLYETAHIMHPRVPIEHEVFLANMKPYHIEDDIAFTHGGFSPDVAVNAWLGPHHWDRSLWSMAASWKSDEPLVTHHDKVFIGHTNTIYSHGTDKPVKASNVWNLDTGAGWEGRLTIMDVHTEEYWQSDTCADLYPDEKGRRS